jgi:allantoin racemase
MSPSAERILVINPNSTQAVTDGIDKAMEPLRMAGGPTIECVTLKEGPPGIETQAHVENVVAPISATVKGRDNDCSAFVIACYSDPGLHAAREVTTKPVLGIAECGILTAMTLGQRFGVISILKKSVPRHLRYVGQMGVADRMAGDRAIGLGVVELSNEATTFARMAEVAAELRDEDGADVLIMGCAGMARFATACSAMSACRSSSPARPRCRWRSAARGCIGKVDPPPRRYRRQRSFSAVTVKKTGK